MIKWLLHFIMRVIFFIGKECTYVRQYNPKARYTCYALKFPATPEQILMVMLFSLWLLTKIS